MLLAAYVLRTLGRSIEVDAAESELLIEELASERPKLLPPESPSCPLPALDYQPEAGNKSDDATEEPVENA